MTENKLPTIYTPEVINEIIKNERVDTNLISDGYHTFGELYEHRITLFIALCKTIRLVNAVVKDDHAIPVWRSKLHSDNSEWPGWFIMGLRTEKGGQISYHLPISKWDETSFCATLVKAPEFDGHTSADVLERLKNL